MNWQRRAKFVPLVLLKVCTPGNLLKLKRKGRPMFLASRASPSNPPTAEGVANLLLRPKREGRGFDRRRSVVGGESATNASRLTGEKLKRNATPVLGLDWYVLCVSALGTWGCKWELLMFRTKNQVLVAFFRMGDLFVNAPESRTFFSCKIYTVPFRYAPGMASLDSSNCLDRLRCSSSDSTVGVHLAVEFFGYRQAGICSWWIDGGRQFPRESKRLSCWRSPRL